MSKARAIAWSDPTFRLAEKEISSKPPRLPDPEPFVHYRPGQGPGQAEPAAANAVTAARAEKKRKKKAKNRR
jgi:hypothetical protein